MLRLSFGMAEAADAVAAVIEGVLDEGGHTRDIAARGRSRVNRWGRARWAIS